MQALKRIWTEELQGPIQSLVRDQEAASARDAPISVDMTMPPPVPASAVPYQLPAAINTVIQPTLLDLLICMILPFLIFDCFNPTRNGSNNKSGETAMKNFVRAAAAA